MANIKARDFVTKWTGRGGEKQETQQYWNGMIYDVLGADSDTIIQYEKPVKINGQTKFIDGYLPETRVLIEQKSLGVDLMKAELQSDGTKLTPYEQGRRYGGYLPYDEQPRWIIDCNFEEIRVHDMKKPGEAPEIIYLKDLEKDYTRLNFMIHQHDEHIQKELELSLKAGELVGKIHDRFLEQYNDPMAKKTQNSLNILCTRLVFCLYAEDAGLFGSKDAFVEYISHYAPGDIRQALLSLFKVLDTPEDERADLYLPDELEEFPYCNGGLFANENIVIPKITQEIKDTLIDAAGFNWADISPTIFGAVFESTLNNETRRSGGMHYTSIENIHKVIDPLFLDDLKKELAEIKAVKVQKTKETKLREYQNKLASLKFLDPACGSGNFLTETYVSLRRLENEVLRELHNGQIVFGDAMDPIKVSIDQFYGFEINDFAVTVAKTALWIAESQMMQETEGIVSMHLDFLPLKTNATIIECNALRIDWWRYVDRHSLSYIMGNPPFLGAKQWQKDSHKKEDMELCFGKKYYNLGILDYVSAWYKKAFDYMRNTNVKCAFVSTNSITQGEQNATLFQPLIEDGLEFQFFYKQFRWDSEASKKAQVFCVIIGFCGFYTDEFKCVYHTDGSISKHSRLNNYFVEAPYSFIFKRSKPFGTVSKIEKGNQPTDGGCLIIERDEISEWRKDEIALKYIRKLIGSTEYLHNKDRYCLWLVNANPSDIRASKRIRERLEALKEFRLKSTDKKIVGMAEIGLFREQKNPENAIVIPVTTSENRRYIPIGFIDSTVITTNSLLIGQNATIYEYGVIQSNVHMAWMRTVTGRMKNDYQYSASIVYNNFPWPSPTDEQKAGIESTAQGILDARAKYPEASLADLYDELAMPIELRKAHQANDRAVMEAYGFSIKMTEQECVAELMKMYQKLVEEAE